MTRSLRGEKGALAAEQVERAVRPGDDHSPRTSVVAIENTHNGAGGRVFPLDGARAVSEVCRSKGVAMHLDGARLFNAQAATGTPAREWADCVDTLTFCFSKGLGAPVGSMVCASAELIGEARRVRKRLGGGMRQVGVVAAAARVALDEGVERLAEDHARARRLAQGLADLDPACVDPDEVETNMVYVDLEGFGKTADQVGAELLEEGIVTLGGDGYAMRLVTHRDVDSDDTERALDALKRVLRGSA